MSTDRDRGGGLADEIETQVSSWLDDAVAPGASVAVVSPSDVRYVGGFGARDRADNAPVTPDTLFGIGSCTKSLTALSILQLADSGALSLSDPLSAYLPHLADEPGDDTAIHDLLSHGSGHPSDGYLSDLLTQLTGRGGDVATLPIGDEADFRSHVERHAGERVTDSGQRFYYNTGFALLGLVIEEVTDRSFAAHVRDRLLDPLGMSRSCFSAEQFRERSDRMTPYRRDGDALVEDDLAVDPLLYAPAGLFSSAAEMASYLQLFLNDGVAGGTRLVESASLDAMTTGQTPWSTSIDGADRQYGYGVFVEPFLDDTLVSHGGMMETTTGWFGFLEDAARGVFVASNTTPDTSLSVLGRSLLAVSQGVDPDATVPERVLDRKIEPLVGTYRTLRGRMVAEVERHGGGIRLQADNPGWTADYVATPRSMDPDTRRFRAVDGRGHEVDIEFVVSAEGVSLRVDRWHLHRT